MVCDPCPFSPWILKGSQLVLPLAFPFVPTPGVAVTKEQAREQTVRVFTPKDLPERAPVLLFFHGGGFGYPAAPHHKQLAAELSKRVGCRVVMPEYRSMGSGRISFMKAMCNCFKQVFLVFQ